MSQVFISFIIVGTAITAVSFLLFTFRSVDAKSVKKLYWRHQGEQISNNFYKYFILITFVLVIIALNKFDKQIHMATLPISVILIFSLLMKQGSQE